MNPTLILLTSIIVFVAALIGSYIPLNNRVLSALVQTVLFAVVFAAVTAYLTAGPPMVIEMTPMPAEP